MNVDSNILRKRIVDLETFIASEVFQVWQRSRASEIEQFNLSLLYDAKTWDEVVELRAMRENTQSVQNSFEELCETLKTELDLVIESETQIAGSTKV